MIITNWLSDNYIEIFGAITGIIYVFLEIRQTIWLWPVGIITSAVYIWVFFTGKLYADMSLQGYYLAISFMGWYWWTKGAGHGAQGTGHGAQGTGYGAQGTGHRAQDQEQREEAALVVTRLAFKTGLVLAVIFSVLFIVMWLILSELTDSPVPGWDSFITSLSIVATWMLARKIYEHWLLWIVVNTVSAFLFITRGLYPTVVLYIIYGIMSFVGLTAWKKTIRNDLSITEK